VAQLMDISIQTVKNHKTSIFKKLNVHSSIEAFYKMGWLILPGESLLSEVAKERLEDMDSLADVIKGAILEALMSKRKVRDED